jgi:FG-GAP repeat
VGALVGQSDQELEVFLSEAGGVFAPKPADQYYFYGTPLAVVDLNGDHTPDVVTDSGVAYGVGSGVLAPGHASPPAGMVVKAVGDVNGDGKPDLIVAGGVLINATP